MSENNYGALMMKSALSANVDIDSLTQPGIYPVPAGNPSSPDFNGGTLSIYPGTPKIRVFSSDALPSSTSTFSASSSTWGDWSIPSVTPLLFNSLKECFESGYQQIYIPKGEYTIYEETIIRPPSNIHILCEEGAKFKLADNVRKDMLVFIGDGSNSFSWTGGEIDGNYEGQGPETMTDGRVNDVSHGLIMSNFYSASIDSVYGHDCMGHHFNHGGNVYFTARKIKVRSHISTNLPVGGARGDGITGTSRFIDIDGVHGYSSDDMVGIFSGIGWIKGIGQVRDIKSVRVRNTNCEHVIDTDGTTKRYTWHGVTVTSTNGYEIEKILIDGISGEFQNGGIRMSASITGNSDYSLVNIGDAIVSNVNSFVAGVTGDGFTSSKSKCSVYIGFHDPEKVPTSSSYFNFRSLTISNIIHKCSGNTFSAINVGHASLGNLTIDNLSIDMPDNTSQLQGLYLCGSRHIKNIRVSNVSFNNSPETDDNVIRNRRVVYSELDSTEVTNFYGYGLYGKSGIGNFLMANAYANKFNLYGYDIILEAPKNFTSAQNNGGVHFTDRYLGRVKTTSKNFGWEFEDWFSTWDSANFGRPSASNMPGFANISNWGEGTVIPVIGSPYHECTGWVCRSGTPTFQLLSPVYTDFYGTVTPAWNPVGCTPGVEIITHIPSNSTADWPVTGGGMVKTSVSTTGTGAGTVMEFTSWSLQRFVRIWQANNWTYWKKISA